MPAATAIREATEEVGLDPARRRASRSLGSLDPVWIPVSGFRLTPVIAVRGAAARLRAEPREVSRILEPPLAAFLPGCPIELVERELGERFVRYGAYPIDGLHVWGATARVLGQLGAVVGPDVRARPRGAAPPGSAGSSARRRPRSSRVGGRERLDPDDVARHRQADDLRSGKLSSQIAGRTGRSRASAPRCPGEPAGRASARGDRVGHGGAQQAQQHRAASRAAPRRRARSAPAARPSPRAARRAAVCTARPVSIGNCMTLTNSCSLGPK